MDTGRPAQRLEQYFGESDDGLGRPWPGCCRKPDGVRCASEGEPQAQVDGAAGGVEASSCILPRGGQAVSVKVLFGLK